MFLVELIASSFLDLISKQARLNVAVSAFSFFVKMGMYLFLYNNRFKERFQVKVRSQKLNTQPLVTDVVSHLNFTTCISFFALFFHFVELICLVPFQDGNKECLSDVDDLGN